MKEIHEQSRLLGYLDQYKLESIFSNEVKEYLTLHQFSKGEILCSKGDQLHSMYFMVKGKFKVYAISSEGNTLIVRFKTPLAIIGDVEFVNGMSVLNTVEAVSDGELIGVSYDVLRTMQSKQVEFLQFLLKIITEKLYTESQSNSLNLLLPVEVRLASYLLSLSSEGEGNIYHKEMRTTNLTEVAALIGTSYRHLNRVIQKLVLEGIIERNKGSLTIKDLPRLRERANGHIHE
ncbi:Crp/Fnr family transcriptional regulator [Bacillus sp. JJ1764]|uniref:Crp/Fnr family transcriptional regulator n=1 Tax=Bacillus sp. JJ1764 TaxID=3122964 RepID=UPI002FFE54A7